MQASIVEKPTRATGLFFAKVLFSGCIAFAAGMAHGASTVVLTAPSGPATSATRDCRRIFKSAPTLLKKIEVTKLIAEPRMVDAILHEPRALRMQEIMTFGMQLFLANMHDYAASKQFDVEHEVKNLRVFKFLHLDQKNPLHQYRAAIGFSQKGVDYEVDIVFRSNGHFAYIESTDPTRAIATGPFDQFLKFEKSEISKYLELP